MPVVCRKAKSEGDEKFRIGLEDRKNKEIYSFKDEPLIPYDSNGQVYNFIQNLN